MGWVGSGQLSGGLGWAGSMKVDPWTTLILLKKAPAVALLWVRQSFLFSPLVPLAVIGNC